MLYKTEYFTLKLSLYIFLSFQNFDRFINCYTLPVETVSDCCLCFNYVSIHTQHYKGFVKQVISSLEHFRITAVVFIYSIYTG